MLAISLVLVLLALPQAVLDLLGALATPVLVPAVTSGVFWLVNTYLSWVAKQPNLVKRFLVVVIGTGLGYFANHFGLDVTTAQGFAGSLVALGIFALGQKKGANS